MLTGGELGPTEPHGHRPGAWPPDVPAGGTRPKHRPPLSVNGAPAQKGESVTLAPPAWWLAALCDRVERPHD
jgi:hypothetical protein